MEIKIHDITFELPEIYQYEDYRYAAECCCPECSRTDSYYSANFVDYSSTGIVGYCVQNDGSYCLCFECPRCGIKYRYHYAEKWRQEGDKFIFDIEYWKHYVGVAIMVRNEKTKEYEHFLKK